MSDSDPPASVDGGQLGQENDLRQGVLRPAVLVPEANTAPPLVATVGCFSYARHSANVVRMHFRSAEADGGSPLAAANTERRRSELATLFAHLKRTMGEDVAVLGISWLYNLDAYRRLFPAAYTASSQVVRGRFQSMPLWGQFLNHCGQVKPLMRTTFLRALAEQTTLAGLDDCFPLQVLTVQAPARQFHDYYGV